MYRVVVFIGREMYFAERNPVVGHDVMKESTEAGLYDLQEAQYVADKMTNAGYLATYALELGTENDPPAVRLADQMGWRRWNIGTPKIGVYDYEASLAGLDIWIFDNEGRMRKWDPFSDYGNAIELLERVSRPSSMFDVHISRSYEEVWGQGELGTEVLLANRGYGPYYSAWDVDFRQAVCKAVLKIPFLV
jgi:hypothetical protein